MLEEEPDPMADKGIGPVTELVLPAEIDQAMVEKGKAIYNEKCTTCHKLDGDFLGPSQVGVLERRSPEWVMNMILNPDEMLAKDPIAMELLVKYKNYPMTNQKLTEEEARSVLEFFRSL